MTGREYLQLEEWYRILKEIEKEYPCSTIGNIITQVKSRIEHYDKG